VEVIFRADDLVDPVYFGETLPSRLRRRYVGLSAGVRRWNIARLLDKYVLTPQLPFG